MKKEYQGLQDQNTWTLTELPEGRKALKGKWVLKVKHPPNEEPIYKARWVAKGF